MIENENRIRQAAKNIKRFFRDRGVKSDAAIGYDESDPPCATTLS
jgi:hypothetical protein